MNRVLACLSVLGFFVSVGLADRPSLQKVGPAERLTPTRLGRMGPGNTVVAWTENGARQQCWYRLVFDCFEPNALCCAPGYQCPDLEDGYPIGGNSCGGDPDDGPDGCVLPGCADRWYFGPDHCNPYCWNDMQFDPQWAGEYVQRLEVAWYWNPPAPMNMALTVTLWDDFSDWPAPGGEAGDGGCGSVIMLFGETGSGDGYYYADVDLCDLDWMRFQPDAQGSYKIEILTYVGDDPVYPDDFSLACPLGGAQPMLWGCGLHECPIPDDYIRGCEPLMSDQWPVQWDDDNPTNWHHDWPQECYDYTCGLCPDPLGAMVCFYADRPCEEECPGDIDGDGDTDQADLGELLAAWGSQSGDPNWNPNADLDGDGHVGQGDLGILLADWGCGVGK